MEQHYLGNWQSVLKDETEKEYYKELVQRVAVVPSDTLCPPPSKVFRVYQEIPPEKVKVVILGLDPYIKGEACGFSFSSEVGKIPPSLRIIFNALLKEFGQKRTDANLEDWVKQGVFLLNTVLTTERGKTLAHGSWGWQNFTGATLKHLAQSPQPVSFMIWGQEAKKAAEAYILPHIAPNKQVLVNCHPMAEIYGRYKFSEAGHFKQVNDFLVAHHETPILWALNSAPTTLS